MFKAKYSKKLLFLVLLIVTIGIPTISGLAAPGQWVFVSRGSSTSGRSPTWVTPSDGSRYGCGTDDDWIGFRGVPQNKIIPTNKMKIWSTNLVNQQHIKNHGGLNGYFECYQNVWCNVFLCGKDGGLANGWSHKLELLP